MISKKARRAPIKLLRTVTDRARRIPAIRAVVDGRRMQVATVPTPLRHLTLLNIIPLAWLVFITITYLLTATAVLGHSSYLGVKQAWPILAIIATVAAAGLGIGASRQQTLARLVSKA